MPLDDNAESAIDADKYEEIKEGTAVVRPDQLARQKRKALKLKIGEDGALKSSSAGGKRIRFGDDGEAHGGVTLHSGEKEANSVEIDAHTARIRAIIDAGREDDRAVERARLKAKRAVVKDKTSRQRDEPDDETGAPTLAHFEEEGSAESDGWSHCSGSLQGPGSDSEGDLESNALALL